MRYGVTFLLSAGTSDHNLALRPVKHLSGDESRTVGRVLIVKGQRRGGKTSRNGNLPTPVAIPSTERH